MSKVTITCPVCGKERTMPAAWLRKLKTQAPTCSRHCKGVLGGQRWAAHGHKGRANWKPESEARHSEGMKQDLNPNWKGGRRLRDDGYIEVLQPDHPRAKSTGYVLEHILVMEATLGRVLQPPEVVHHIDGDKTNNAAENLQLFASQSEHVRVAHGAVSRR